MTPIEALSTISPDAKPFEVAGKPGAVGYLNHEGKLYQILLTQSRTVGAIIAHVTPSSNLRTVGKARHRDPLRALRAAIILSGLEEP